MGVRGEVLYILVSLSGDSRLFEEVGEEQHLEQA